MTELTFILGWRIIFVPRSDVEPVGGLHPYPIESGLASIQEKARLKLPRMTYRYELTTSANRPYSRQSEPPSV